MSKNKSIKKNTKVNRKNTHQKELLLPPYWVFPKLDAYIEKRLKLFFYIAIVTTAVIGANLFDLKISEGGDDSTYIVNAKHFLDGVSFPTWHGSLYPIFLSPFLALFGINLFVFKLLSFIAVIVHLVIFYKAFKKMVAPTFLVIILFILAVNSHLLYYASQTYSEAFYMLLQMWFAFIVIKIIDNRDKNNFQYQKALWKNWLLVGFATFCVVQTRNVGLAAIMSLVFIFLAARKPIIAGFALGSFAIVSFPWRLYKMFYWNLNESGASQQFNKMLLKNPYNAALGTEDFNGMVTRFFENMETYLSKHFSIILGLKPEDSTEISLIPAILIAAILLVTFALSYRKNFKIFFITTFTIAGILATLISQQVFWGQPRLILIFIPFMLIIICWLFTFIAKYKNLKIINLVLASCLVLIFFKTLGISIDKLKAHEKELKDNIRGDYYAGFTPDWKNFLKMGEWAGENLPDTIKIASRKPSMSYIYGGGRIEYHGIFRLLTYNAASFIDAIKSKTDGIIAVDLNQKSVNESNQVRYFLGRTSVGYIYNNSKNYMLVDTRKYGKGNLEEQLYAANIKYIPSINNLEKVIDKEITKYSATSPDSLLQNLYKNDVDYVIRGNLRIYANRKTEHIISTVLRYLYFVDMKYPGIFTQIHQEGKNEDEPAYIYKINYNAYNLNFDNYK
jgi:hypothetical protein